MKKYVMPKLPKGKAASIPKGGAKPHLRARKIKPAPPSAFPTAPMAFAPSPGPSSPDGGPMPAGAAPDAAMGASPMDAGPGDMGS